MTLFPSPVYRPPASIDLRCCGVDEVLAEVRDARLVHADPPWSYDAGGLTGQVAGKYSTLGMPGIADHLRASFDCAAPDAYLLCWATWPTLAEWMAAAGDIEWTYKTGACWGKSGSGGIGYHLRGSSEPLLVYVKGNPRPIERLVSNHHISDRGKHSEKPTEFLSRLLGAFTAPSDLVLDLYAGLAPMARACMAGGRHYVGAEIDPERHARALDALAASRR